MRPRELFRGPMGPGVDGEGQRVLRGQGGRLGDPMGPSGWFYESSDDG